MYEKFADSVLRKSLLRGAVNARTEELTSIKVADSVKLMAKAMLVLASFRPDLTTGTIINSRHDSYGFPLLKLRGYSELALIFIPVINCTGGPNTIKKLRAVSIHTGSNNSENGAQISLVFKSEEEQTFDVVSFDNTGCFQAERRRAFGKARYSVTDVKSCVLSALGIGRAIGCFACSDDFETLGWSAEKLTKAIDIVAEYLCTLSIRQ